MTEQSSVPSTFSKRAEEMNCAIAWFGVEPTPKIISLIASINLYHHDRVMMTREIEPLRAICGEPAILANVEVGQ